MKKIVLRIAVVCVLTFSLCFSVFGGSAKAVNTVTADGDEKMYIYFFPVNTGVDGNGNLIPNKSGKVTVEVMINKPNDGVRLTIKTRDKSALAAESDYIAQSEDIHLVSTDSSDSREFTVQTCNAGAANLISNESYYADYGYTRVFEILVCNIKTDSGCDYVVSNEWGKKEEGSLSFDARVQTTYNYEYSEKTGKNGLYFTDYLYGKSFASAWFDRNKIYYQTPSGSTCVSVDNDTNYEYNPSFSRFIAYDYLVKYYETGWADIYYGGSATISESSWCTIDTPAILQLIGDGGKTVFYSEYYDPKSSGAPILFGDTGYSNNSDDYRYKLTDKAKRWINSTDGYTVINTDDPMYSHAYCYYTHKNYNFPSVTGKLYKDNSEYLNLKITRDSTWKMNFEYLRLDSELYDTTSPKITKTSLSDITTTDNKTLRLSVRFSEPVHFPTDLNDKSGVIVTGYADNKGAMPLKFVYAGGEGSDTLYFDCNLNDYETLSPYNGSKIQNITFRDDGAFSSACKGISDYAYNFSLNNNFADLSSFGNLSISVNIDLRTPVVMSEVVGGTSAAQSHTVNIHTTNMDSEGSKLYYTWVKASDISGDSGDYVPSEYDNCETLTPTSVTVIGEKLNGEYYLYYMAESSYGKRTYGHTEKALKFDNTPIEISSFSLGNPNAALPERTVSLKLNGQADDLAEIIMKYRAAGETEWQSKTIYFSGGNTGDDTISSLVYNKETDETEGTFTLDGKATLGMSDSESKLFYFRFVTIDKSNNSCEYTADTSYRFDTSERCAVNLDISGTPYTVYDEIETSGSTTIDGDKKSYKNSYFASGFSLTFGAGSLSEIVIESLYKGDADVTADKDKYFKCYLESDNKYIMEYFSEHGGYFSIQIGGDGKKSEVFSFFLAGESDEVDGYIATVTNKLVVNKVWVVSDISYYYMSENSTPKKENYNATKKLPLAFSSKDKALQYYTYMEQQDVSLFYISSDNDAKALNGGYNETFKKAQNEKTAEKGETWIRYKSSAWDQTSDSKYWNYYYYSSTKEAEINISRFSTNLRSAINSVVSKIVNKGSYVYLAEDDDLDARGTPQLDSSRIKSSAESVDVTKTGTTKFTTSIYFSGDSGIYASTYKSADGSEYPFAVRKLAVAEYTSFYFKNHNGGYYEKLNVSDSFYLKDVISGTGVYDVIERTANGIREYSVYVDNSSPEITVLYDNNSGEQELTITKNDAEKISALNVKSFSFVSLDDTDEYAYVAVFSSGGVYKGAYLAGESEGESLAEGRYIIKVYDRSGNGFEFYLRISTADLQSACSIKNEPNQYIQFTCTYSKDDIYRFEIYLDGVLVTDNVDSLSSNRKKLYDAGEYRFYVEDLFGNVYDKTETLVREIPEVIWYYERDGALVKVDESAEDTVGFVKTKLGSSSYLITTNGYVRFRYSAGDYEYEFLSGRGTSTHVGNYIEVAVSQTDNWQVKIYYKDCPDLFVTYMGKSDSSGPTISVITNRVKYSYADENENAVKNYFLTHKDIKVGDIINLDDVSFVQTDVVTETVKDGELISGSLVTLRISDSSDIYKWSYTYNGAVTEYTGNMSDKMIFGKEGSYVIEATDKIGNVSTYSFRIGRSEFTELGVDDLDGIVSKYGNKNVIAKLAGAGEFVFVVNGEYFRLVTDGTNLKRILLKVAKNDSGFYPVEEEITLSESLTSKPLVISETDSYSVQVSTDGETICLKTALKERVENEIHKINVGISVRSGTVVECKYAETEISDELSYVNYVFNETTSVLNKTLNVNGSVTLTCSEDVSWYCVRFSVTDDFDSSGNDFYFGDFVCDKEGFYQVVSYNKYGNSSTIKIIYQVGISVVGIVGYADGESVTYSVNYDGDFCSNNYVSIRIYNDVGYFVTKDGTAYTPEIGYAEGGIIVTVRGNGEFVFGFTDKFGNKETRKATINLDNLDYSDEWLDGFNENALKKSEGYTNSKVYFIKSNLLDCGVKSIIVKTPDGERIGVYDYVAEEKYAFDENFVIGDNGDGEYEIIFRDVYGNKVGKSVNYRSQSTLIATRITRSMEKQSYVVDATVARDGIWCNKTINLVSEASGSVFTVNSEKRDLPFSLDFPSDSAGGKYEYVMEYTDEYGFSFKFKCILYRTTIEVEPYGMNVNDGVTKDPVAVSFDDNCTAKIFINGEELGAYESGTKYLQDGNYIISVKDVAGNVANYSVKRDSIADFCFYVGTAEQKLVSGEAVNESVRFAPLNGDVVSYYSVYRDGKEIEGYDSSTFGESGKWEIVLKDEVGNKDYFCFYLLTHSLTKFDYTTPRGFKITEVTYDGGGGKVDWTEAAEDKDGGSYLNFEESGTYEVVMTSYLTGKTSGFSIVIDKSVPKIVLKGVENGGVTKQNVEIGGYKEGDTVYIYKDGVLSKEIKVAVSSDVAEITEKGKYRIVVVNEAGGSSEVEFTRVYTANTATSTLIIVVILAVVAGLFAGLLFRKHSRIE